MAVDKNLPAMLDEKAYTVHVCFQHAAAALAQLPDSARNDIAALLKGEK